MKFRPPPPLLFLLLLLGSAYAALAQPLRIEYFTVNDGLSSRDVTDLHVGADGFLWVGTLDGLNRFDGHSFLRFGESPGADTRLSRGTVSGVAADNDGHLIVTFRDVYAYFDRFDPRDFSVTPVRLAPSTGISGYPRAIRTDGLGRTFAVTVGERGTLLYEYTPEGFQEIVQLPDDWGTIAPRSELLPLANGQFLLYDEEHAFRHLAADGRPLDTLFAGNAAPRRFYDFAEGPDGFVYFTFRDGWPLFRWWPGSGLPPTPVPGLDDGLRYPRIYRDELGQLLLPATEDILGELQPDEYYLLDTTGRLSLFEEPLPTDRRVTALAAHNWRETTYLGLREGLGVVERYANPVRTFLENDREDESFQHTISGLCEDEIGRVYAADRRGNLFFIDPGAGRVDPLTLLDAEGAPLRLREVGGLLHDPARQAIWGFGRPTGRTTAGLLFRHDIASGLTDSYRTEQPTQSLALAPDGQTLYLAGRDPRRVSVLTRFNPTSGEFTTVEGFNRPRSPGGGMGVNALLVQPDGRLLVGTTNRGLVTFDPATEETRQHVLVDTEGAQLGNRSVNVIRPDSAGYWVGTDGGLYFLSTAPAAPPLAFTRQDGLSSNVVQSIVADTAGGLWLGTRNGLNYLPADRNTRGCRRYFREDGLANDEFTPGHGLRDRGGRYVFGGVNGLTVFRDGDLSSEMAGADVMLTSVVVYGRGRDSVYNRRLDELRQLTVFAHQKGMSFSFALPVGQRPSSSRIRVKLDGFDEDWQELLNERTVRYNNIPAGHYRLLVQGAGANGNYGDRMFSLDVHVRQYVIERLWFQALLILIFAGLITFMLQSKLRERLRNERLRTQLSSDIHDEVSGLLAGITLQAELLKSRTDDEKLRQRLHTVGEAGRSAMSKMSDVIWSIDSRRDTIGNLLQRMQEHADEVLLPLDIRYEFSAEGFDRDKKLPGTVRQDVYFIYKEAINNIARHSRATRVDIRLRQFAQTFEMYVRDNGVGEGGGAAGAVPTTKTGQGLDNLRMRANRLGGTITARQHNGYALLFRRKRLA